MRYFSLCTLHGVRGRPPGTLVITVEVEEATGSLSFSHHQAPAALVNAQDPDVRQTDAIF